MKRRSYFLAIFCALLTFPACSPADNLACLLSSGRTPARPQARTTIPFKLIGRLIIVKAAVDGAAPDSTFVLDTGSITAVSKRFATRLGLRMEGNCYARGATGAGDKVCLTRLKSLALGGVEARDIPAVVFDPHFRQRAGIKVDGFIGSNFLRFFKVKIDYQKKLLTLSNPTAPLAMVPGATLVTIGQNWKSAFVPQVRLRCGAASFIASVDTGLYDSLSIPGPFLARANVVAQIKANGAMGSGNFGNMDKTRMVRLSGLSIGSLTIPKAIATSQSGQSYALIGYGLLSNFTVTIDYPARQMLLVPSEGGQPIGNLFSTGLAISRDYAGKTYVSGVWTPSPARRLGLAPGAVITAVDGRPAGSYTLAGLQRLLFDNTIPRIDLSIQEPLGEKSLDIEKKYLF